MSDLGIEFDASAIDGDSGFETLPNGVYSAKAEEITARHMDSHGREIDLKTERAQLATTEVIVKSRISGPKFANRVLMDWILIYSTNEADKKKLGFGQRRFANLLKATGRSKVTNTDVLIGAPYSLKVGSYQTRGDNPETKNSVQDYKPAAGAIPAGAIPVGASAAPSKPDWMG